MPKPKSPRKPPKPIKLPPPLERDVQAAILQAAKVYGLDLNRQNTGAMKVVGKGGKTRHVQFGQAGNSDLSGCLNDGRRIDVEVKRPGEKPTAVQYARLRKTNALGGVGFWVDDVAVFVRIIQKLQAGYRVEIDDDGTQWLTDEPREGVK